jgi:carboxyl-terminal processing protease
MRRILYVIPFLFLLALSCEKDNTSPTKTDTDQEIIKNWDKSPEAYLRDSTLYLTKLLSLWQESIVPSNINDILDTVKVRRITKDYDKAEDLLDYLTGLTPKDSKGQPYDRFSFLDRQGAVAEEIQEGTGTSCGIYVLYLQTAESAKDNNNADLYVRMLDLNSPAYIAGLRRGDRILSINGNTKYDYNTQKAQNFKGINDALNSESMTIKWQKPNGEIIEKTITQAKYNINPILSTWVKDIEGKKVGYFAFSSFISIINNQGQSNSLYTSLQNLFNNYETQGVSELIVDLRYNGGGSTYTAEYLANKLAPAAATGKRMYYYKLNPIVQEELAEEFKPVDFKKIGNLNLTKVYFLVTSSTASASELLINSLKPYLNVQIIGSENTYGKPVGFWGIPIGKKGAQADIYVTSFQMFNADNYGNYFEGLVPNKLTREDFLKDFGDVEEGFIAEAIYHIKNGSYSTATRSAVSAKDAQRINNTHLLKSIQSTRAADVGMFKFGKEKIKLK